MRFKLDLLVSHAELAVKMANENRSKLNNDILSLDGMSGKKTRHLYNNICNIDGCNYLEVGTWKGSSFISSLFKNNINAIAIDNWSEFNGPKETFLKNVNKFCPENNYTFFEKNAFDVKEQEIKSVYESIDIFLYDGCHKYESHKLAITFYEKFLSKYSIILVDDWRDDSDWQRVQKGTYDGFKSSNLKIHHKIEKITRQELNGAEEYWNGFGLFVCENLNF